MDLEKTRSNTERPKQASTAKKSVLVVDDDAAFARLMRRVLEGAGYEVVATHNGNEAIDAMTRRRFDVVLSDIEMPGLTGVDLLSLVRVYDLDVPVLLITGAATVETAMDAISLGALQYLLKPISSEVLVGAVDRAVHLHDMARGKREALKILGRSEREAGDRAGLKLQFDRAMATLSMAFQPVVDTRRRCIFGYEALMRSQETSLPHPGAILSAAERLGRVDEVGRRVRALSAAAFGNAPSDAVLFVNVLATDLLDPELYEVDAPLSKIASRVVLEITERSTIENIKDVWARVSILRYHGFRIAIDDLGAGYAGLSTFVALEPEIVKLDMSLVRNVHRSVIRQKLVRSMIRLSKDMGMKIVAEGVEQAEERDCLHGLDCELVQGYLFARPGPPFPTARFHDES
jgi:EAL domain-containing protein (putative c-di-GMP-specific phosphodiesterase class I)/AmiR/NasT family two-component response regulator